MVIRGTTPTFHYTFKFATDFIADLRWSFRQEGETLVDKKLKDVTMSDNKVSVKLTQEETLKFMAGVDLEIKMRILTTEGDVISTKPTVEKVEETYNEEILELK